MHAGGATTETIKMMIELGIPRETALYLYDEVFTGKQTVGDDEEDLESQIRDQLQKSFNDLPYCVQVQLEFLI